MSLLSTFHWGGRRKMGALRLLHFGEMQYTDTLRLLHFGERQYTDAPETLHLGEKTNFLGTYHLGVIECPRSALIGRGEVNESPEYGSFGREEENGCP